MTDNSLELFKVLELQNLENAARTYKYFAFGLVRLSETAFALFNQQHELLALGEIGSIVLAMPLTEDYVAASRTVRAEKEEIDLDELLGDEL